MTRRDFVHQELRRQFAWDYQGEERGAVVLASRIDYVCECGATLRGPRVLWDHLASGCTAPVRVGQPRLFAGEHA